MSLNNLSGAAMSPGAVLQNQLIYSIRAKYLVAFGIIIAVFGIVFIRLIAALLGAYSAILILPTI